MLDHGYLLTIVHYDPTTGIFTHLTKRGFKRPGEVVGSVMPNGYWTTTIDGKHHLLHRLAWFYVHGEWPHPYIDHIDGNRANNAIANLRVATQSQNNANMGVPRDNKSGVKGVWWDRFRGKWSARIRKDGKYHNLGRFETIEEAAAAYASGSARLYGEFSRPARLDAPSEPPRVGPAILELF